VKRTIAKALGLSLVISGAFGAGMWFMYTIMWVDTFTKLIEFTERVFK